MTAELDALWARFEETEPDAFLRELDDATADLSPAESAFERAGGRDSLGREDEAIPLYRAALAAGLDPGRRRRCTIQLASSLRNVGEVDEAVRLLREERERGSDALDDAVAAFLALALASKGEEREALSLALGALAPHLPRYQRSLAAYAREL